jgi:fused signal recognition particle receptor
VEVVLIDTAGRLHTKSNLMDELEKIHRVAGKRLAGAPHEVWLVLDATTGQNAIAQAEVFHKILGITGIILTKLDGTAKGGIVVGICHQLKIPIRFIGIGEKADDLRPFDAGDFVDAIFG